MIGGTNHSVDYSTVKADAAGVITVIRHVTATTETSDATDTIERQLLLTDVYAVIKNSDVISWTSHVEEKASSEETGYWSSSWSKTVSVKTDNGASKNWWASSSGPLLELADNDNNRLDILTMRDSSSANYTCAYGGVNYWQQFDFDVFLPDELCPVPASIHGAGISGGLSHVLDIDETILAAFGSFSPESVKWVRYFDRMGGGGVRSTTSFLVFHLGETDWRSTMAFSTRRFADNFEPTKSWKEEELLQVGGMGAYSCANVEDMLSDEESFPVAPGLVWDSHFWWPYQGMFWPPGVDEWTSNFGDGESLLCGSYVHGQNVSDRMISDEYAQANDYNVTMMTYFNFNFFGQDVNLTEAVANDDWTDPSGFILNNFPTGYHTPVTYDWQNSILMDPSDKEWQNWLVSQAREARSRIGEGRFMGLIVDEPHTGEFNYAHDDGISWCGKKCRSSMLGFFETSKLVRDAVDEGEGGGHLVSNQINTFRIDTLRHFDSVFSEKQSDGHVGHACALNSIGVLTMGGMPGTVWTSTSNNNITDRFMQQHLYMGVQPIAPVLGNDHAVLNGDTEIDKLYTDYAVMFEQTRGVRTYLDGIVGCTKENDNSICAANAFFGADRLIIVASGLLGVHGEGAGVESLNLTVAGVTSDSCLRLTTGSTEEKKIMVEVVNNSLTINLHSDERSFAFIVCTI